MPAWLAEAGVDMPDIAPAIAKSSRCPGGRALAVPAIAVPRQNARSLSAANRHCWRSAPIPRDRRPTSTPIQRQASP
jgi:hypothetical protein